MKNLKWIFVLTLTACMMSYDSYSQNPAATDSLKSSPAPKPVNPPPPVSTTVPSTPGKSKDNRPMSQRLSFNVSTAFWASTTTTFFEFTPMITYHFPKIYSIGAGPTYIYNRYKATNTTLSGWGGKVYGQANFTRWLYGYTEYQGISNQYISSYTPEISKSSQYVPSLFLSLGINLGRGRHALNLQALYNVLYDKDTSPYYSAWTYRIGYGF